MPSLSDLAGIWAGKVETARGPMSGIRALALRGLPSVSGPFHKHAGRRLLLGTR
jgi:hypothetical protein